MLKQAATYGRFGAGGALLLTLVASPSSRADESTFAPTVVVPITTAPSTQQRILNADAEPQNWLTTGRNYGETRFSPLAEINDGNAGSLGLVWSYDLDTKRGQEATPLAIDGVVYTTSAWSKIQA